MRAGEGTNAAAHASRLERAADQPRVPAPPQRHRLGMLTPSSNTVLEPVCASMLRDVPPVSVHFGRFRVTRISLADDALQQFSDEPMLAAAELLADSRVDVICWNGTSAGWLGLDRDRVLCASITTQTGVPATSSVLALVEALRLANITRVGLVTPYVQNVQQRIVATLGREGIACVEERHLDILDNFAFGEVPDETLAAMVRDVAQGRPQAVVSLCTNLRVAPLVDALEQELGLMVLDSVATAMWGALRLAGADPARVRGWGRLFQEIR